MSERVYITGTGAVCAAGRTPDEIFATIAAGTTAIGPIGGFDATGYPAQLAGEIVDLDPRSLVPDRKLLKLIRRTDVFGIYAAAQAVAEAQTHLWRETLDPDAAIRFSDRFGCYAGSGGGTFDSQYDYFPLLTEAHDDLPTFGRELSANVNPMWLLRSLPNNVLCHVSINHGLKGANACITHHSIGGTLALVEVFEALRSGEADRAVAVGHEAPIEPQNVLYYYRAGLLATGPLKPFDAARTGSLFGEGAGAVVAETAAAVAERKATVLGEILGSGSASEAEGLLAISDDGEGLERAIRLALDNAGLATQDVGMIVAHANGTRNSDRTEAEALVRVFGKAMPPVTGFKWAFGHLLAASGAIETVLALVALRKGVVPGIAVLDTLDGRCAGLNVTRDHRAPTSSVALVLSRGFGSTNTALLVRV
jgi:3-oxoacyl-[acyl-carrier-protein] synthase-1